MQILRAEDAERVAGWLREMRAEVHMRRVELNEDDEPELHPRQVL